MNIDLRMFLGLLIAIFGIFFVIILVTTVVMEKDKRKPFTWITCGLGFVLIILTPLLLSIKPDVIKEESPEPEPVVIIEPQPEPEGPSKPGDAVWTCTASSYDKAQSNDYRPENAIDGNLETVWGEGSRKGGVGQYIIINFDRECVVEGVKIINGWAATINGINKYERNSKVTRAKVIVENGDFYVFNLDPKTPTFQDMKFVKPQVTNWVKIEIMKTQIGSKKNTAYRRASISEIVPY